MTEKRKSPLAALSAPVRTGFLKGARWARDDERRFRAPRRGSRHAQLVSMFADHEAMVAVEGSRHREGEYA